MNSLFKLCCAIMAVALLATSCKAYKKIPYIENAASLDQTTLSKAALSYEAKVMPNDILLITVNTPTPEIAADFNLPLIPTSSTSTLPTKVTYANETSGSLQNYVVDKDGYIMFPTLGRLKVGGLTKGQVEKMIHDAVYPTYITENPIVTMRFLNYHVTILGEVNNPGVYTSDNARMTIFDALASAGDLTIYGDREKVLLIRIDDKGEKYITPINLQDRNLLLNNNVYYLQQNDMIYVEPNKSRGNSSKVGSLETLTVSSISLLVSIISVTAVILK